MNAFKTLRYMSISKCNLIGALMGWVSSLFLQQNSILAQPDPSYNPPESHWCHVFVATKHDHNAAHFVGQWKLILHLVAHFNKICPRKKILQQLLNVCQWCIGLYTGTSITIKHGLFSEVVQVTSQLMLWWKLWRQTWHFVVKLRLKKKRCTLQIKRWARINAKNLNARHRALLVCKSTVRCN